MVKPIGYRERSQVRWRTQGYVRLAGRLFERRFAPVPVSFDLAGGTAGMFRRHGRHCEIRYNPWIFGKYYLENLRDTVPHEVAHYIVYQVYGDRGIRPHGAEWRELMGLFGAEPGVTFDLDLEGVPQRRQRTHPYRCACRVHELSSTRHNRVQRGGGEYQCINCHAMLVYAPA